MDCLQSPFGYRDVEVWVRGRKVQGARQESTFLMGAGARPQKGRNTVKEGAMWARGIARNGEGDQKEGKTRSNFVLLGGVNRLRCWRGISVHTMDGCVGIKRQKKKVDGGMKCVERRK